MTRCFSVVFCIAIATIVSAAEPTPSTGLQSQNQEERDKCAAIVRQSFKMPERKPWEEVVARLSPGMSEVEMREILKPWVKEIRKGMGSMVEEGWVGRFDDVFCVSIGLRRRERTIIHVKLFEHMMSYGTMPPKGYTGLWRNYYCNGMKQSESEIRDGIPHGVSLAYYPDGALLHVMTHASGLPHGSETAYFPSGSLKMRGQYELGKRVGEWVWYDEDGTTARSEKAHDVGSGRF